MSVFERVIGSDVLVTLKDGTVIVGLCDDVDSVALSVCRSTKFARADDSTDNERAAVDSGAATVSEIDVRRIVIINEIKTLDVLESSSEIDQKRWAHKKNVDFMKELASSMKVI